ncbi:MAG TPA: hypothetical protein QF508_04800 [Candidatus Thalassarchaeaceae archaeon]|jgi:hypothetical protein|nr:hypothetical protein [Candidatus Thalassarchaeaceae archaeon]MDP7658393.1 hypothetical protein [Candidatus Thalassarchaeaceae archaeon]HJO42706.1 hypothetical protein [Candidatus Thalassarchaeaceae archaeon]
MAPKKTEDTNFTNMVVGSISVTVVLLLILPMIFVVGKDTYYSAYSEGGDTKVEALAQVTDMRNTLSDDEYFIANTMSTPMLVNDWRDPHRTALMIIGPEKPISQTEADSIYDFVTKKGGKVIVAADGTNANRLAEKFGVTFFDAPLNDENQFWLEYEAGEAVSGSWLNVWSLAAVSEDVNEMSLAHQRQGCKDVDVFEENRLNCRLPVMFRSPTGMKYEPTAADKSNPGHRDVDILATASSSAFIDIQGNSRADDPKNPAPGDLALIIRIDYSNITTFDRVVTDSGNIVGNNVDELQVTGSIVFVSDEEVFSNRMWDIAAAKNENMIESCEQHTGHCWLDVTKETLWEGNEKYFSLLIDDMMEHDNKELVKSIREDRSEFQIVFDESRHVTGVISAPFIESMGTVVLLTSNTFLKWLVVLNVGLLLLVAMMVVPEKENWRHVFDLTRFKDRPQKLDPSNYRIRVQQALFTKVRVHYDLTRDQMAIKPPAEVQTMIGDPRLVELAYSQSRKYTPQELRQLMVAIRRWGKN